MKFVFKLTFLFVLISSIVVFIGSLISYRTMSDEIDKEQRWFLEERLESVIRYLERRQPKQPMVRDKMIIVPVDSTNKEMAPVFSDTLVTHVTLQRIEPHFMLTAVKKVGNQTYKITLYDLIIEQDDIEDAVRSSMIKTYLLLLFVSLILSLIVSYIVFRPFQKTLDIIRNFSLGSSEKFMFAKTSTSEFVKLNRFVDEMMTKAQSDYQALKEFSENASHEIQTPIAIAQGKLELLMESANLNEEQMNLINSAQYALSRLSKMGNSLALLTKIENQEFADFERINLSELVGHMLIDFEQLMELKSIGLESQLSEEVLINGNRSLIEILLTNLLNNAVRHNYKGGKIYVELGKTSLIISNTGVESDQESVNLFERFESASEHPGSLGLGLSIAKKICQKHHFSIDYSISSKQHTLTLSWSK